MKNLFVVSAFTKENLMFGQASEYFAKSNDIQKIKILPDTFLVEIKPFGSKDSSEIKKYAIGRILDDETVIALGLPKIARDSNDESVDDCKIFLGADGVVHSGWQFDEIIMPEELELYPQEELKCYNECLAKIYEPFQDAQ